jgi:hypothetical protein
MKDHSEHSSNPLQTEVGLILIATGLIAALIGFAVAAVVGVKIYRRRRSEGTTLDTSDQQPGGTVYSLPHGSITIKVIEDDLIRSTNKENHEAT